MMFEPANSANLPVWVRITAFVGVPSVIALFLVYTLAQAATVTLNRLETRQELHTAQMADHANRTDAYMGDIAKYLRLICIHTSRTVIEASQCR